MSIEIRPAEPADADALGRFGAALARQHHAFDPPRFMLVDGVEEGYRQWLVRESTQTDAVVLVATKDGVPVGYAYGRLEERDWNNLLDACGGFHDLWVDEAARSHGLGRKLTEELVGRLVAMGAPRIVLKTASKNLHAQALFQRLGWRPTMIEMTRET